MHILAHLWQGTIDPWEQFVKGDAAYFSALDKASAEKEKLVQSFPELQKGVDAMLDEQTKAAAIAEQDAFVMGFRLAVQIMVECFTVPGTHN